LCLADCREVRLEDWLDKYVPKGGPPNLHPEQRRRVRLAPEPVAVTLGGKIDNR